VSPFYCFAFVRIPASSACLNAKSGDFSNNGSGKLLPLLLFSMFSLMFQSNANLMATNEVPELQSTSSYD